MSREKAIELLEHLILVEDDPRGIIKQVLAELKKQSKTDTEATDRPLTDLICKRCENWVGGECTTDVPCDMNFSAFKERQPATQKAGGTKAEYLKCFGYADGVYACKCHTCKGQFTGDRRAIACKPCATDMALTSTVHIIDACEAEKERLEENAKEDLKEIERLRSLVNQLCEERDQALKESE